ncbi:MAG: hypothetical protein IKI58_12220 [Oscillospiraceae bacterium]|nr:hypothetical protein [Oscillospiraceae bacterium]
MRFGMKRLACIAGAAMLCCTVLTGCEEEKKTKKLSSYQMKSKITAENTASKSIYTSIQATITDMNAEDVNMSGLGGVYIMKGKDFQFDEAPGKDGALKDKLYYRMSIYFPEIVKLDQVSFELQEFGGNYPDIRLLGVAVEKTDDKTDTDIYGAHPNQMTVDVHKKIKSIEDALAYAETGSLKSK